MNILPYDKTRKEFSKFLRNNSTLAEILLWKELRAGGMMGYTFNRQKPIDKYIVDFYCKPLKLVIEIDGSTHQHTGATIKDDIRQQRLESYGLTFLRFGDIQVKTSMANVL